MIIDGPPGTGESQTIANVIAELLTAGRTVLVVSEKTAALEVVKRRLDDRGLDDFCLELHSHNANKREVAAELGRCLDLGPECHKDVATELRLLADDRHRLNAYAAELHRPRRPLGMSAFQVHGELARLATLADLSRWATADVLTRDAEFLRRAIESLGGLSLCRAVIENPGGHPWRGCLFTTVTQVGLDDARHHLGRVAGATARLAAGTTLTDLALTEPVDSLARWRPAVEFARQVLAVPLVPPDWFRSDPASAAATARAPHSATVKVRRLNESLVMFSRSGGTVTDAGLTELAVLGNLAALNLIGTGVTDKSLEELARLKNLTELHIGATRVTDVGLKTLARLKNLTKLDLWGTDITDEGLKELAPLTDLSELDLCGTAVTAAGLKELAALKKLTALDLNLTKVTDADLKELVAIEGLVVTYLRCTAG